MRDVKEITKRLVTGTLEITGGIIYNELFRLLGFFSIIFLLRLNNQSTVGNILLLCLPGYLYLIIKRNKKKDEIKVKNKKILKDGKS